MNMKFGFTVFLLSLLLVNLPGILGRKCKKGGECKVNEKSEEPLDLPRLCGDQIFDAYNDICSSMWSKRRRRRDAGADVFVLTKHEAQDFLSFRRRKRHTGSTDVLEECCSEMCRTEEIKEYC